VSITAYHYSSFTTQPGKGNPAGLVFDADHLTDEQMQQIAHEVGFNETTFVC
jgi:PhzF family phenazine biosynthesis protein